MIFPRYKVPDPKEPPEVGHMHEYTAFELGETVKAAGFEICSLFTTFLEEYEGHRHLMKLLEANGYDVTYSSGVDTECRGNLLLQHRAFAVSQHNSKK